jgi:hypothetical protein
LKTPTENKDTRICDTKFRMKIKGKFEVSLYMIEPTEKLIRNLYNSNILEDFTDTLYNPRWRGSFCKEIEVPGLILPLHDDEDAGGNMKHYDE